MGILREDVILLDFLALFVSARVQRTEVTILLDTPPLELASVLLIALESDIFKSGTRVPK